MLLSSIDVLNCLFTFRKMRIEQEIGKKAWMVTVDEIQVRKEKMNDSFMSKSCLSLNVNSKVTV